MRRRWKSSPGGWYYLFKAAHISLWYIKQRGLMADAGHFFSLRKAISAKVPGTQEGSTVRDYYRDLQESTFHYVSIPRCKFTDSAYGAQSMLNIKY